MVFPSSSAAIRSIAAGRGLGGGAVGLGRNQDPAPDLAVDLHRHLNLSIFQECRIERRPGRMGQRLLVAENLPELFGKMRGQGSEQEREGFHRLAGSNLGRGERVDELHQPADRRVEPQGLDVVGHGRNRPRDDCACSGVAATSRTCGSRRISWASASTIIRQARPRKR